jgi:hypothetical protein
VSALLGYEFRRMAPIQINTLAGVPRRQPGQLGRVAEREPQVLSGVPSGQRDTPCHHRGGCPLMVGDVPLRQASVLLAVPCVQTLVRGQMPAVQRRMLFDMAVFNSRVFRDVSRTGFRSLRCLIGHIDHSSSY